MVQLPPSSCHWPLALRALSTDARSRLDSLNLRIVCRFIPAHCFLAFFAGGLVAGVRTPLLSCVRVPFPRCEPVRNLQPRDSCIMSLTAYSWCRCRLLLTSAYCPLSSYLAFGIVDHVLCFSADTWCPTTSALVLGYEHRDQRKTVTCVCPRYCYRHTV